MQLKPITAIIVLLLVVVSLLVAGCTTSTTSNTNQTPSATPSTETHNATLEKYLAAFKEKDSSNKNLSITTWEVEWINSTSARVTAVLNSTNVTYNSTTPVSWNDTFIVFPTSQDATNYLSAMNKTEFGDPTSSVFWSQINQNVTGHAPEINKMYTKPVSVSKTISKNIYILQLDNLIMSSS